MRLKIPSQMKVNFVLDIPNIDSVKIGEMLSLAKELAILQILANT